MINLIRCDDRLIHGQCMTRIVQHFFVKHIIVVDDFTASNRVMKLVFEKAVPPGMKANVYAEKECVEHIKTAVNNNVGTLVLVKSPIVAKALFEQIDDLPKAMMVGPIAMKAGAKVANSGTYLKPDEIEAVREMVEEKGIDIYFQTVPDQKRFNWTDVKEKLK